MAQMQLPSKLRPLFQPSRYKALHGGRGGAKSRSIAAALILRARQKPLRVMCTREIQNSIRDSVKRILDDEIERQDAKGFFDSNAYRIFGKNGSEFIFEGLHKNTDKIKSYEGIDIVWVEEAHTITQHSLDILIPTIRKAGSEIWFSWNRNSKKDPVDTMFLGENGPPPDSIVINVNWRDNPWFPEVLMAQMEYDKRHDIDKYNHVWEGEPVVHSAAQVFYKKWRMDNTIAPDPDDVLYYGADWGFSVDPSTLLRCWINEEKRELYVDKLVYQVGVEIDHLPRFFDRIPGARKWKIRADNARPETISYMKRQGFKVEPCKKGAGSIEDGIQFLKGYTIVVHDDCVELIDELKLYSYKIDPHTDEILPIIVDKHNHCIDALRYAVEQIAFKTHREIRVMVI